MALESPLDNFTPKEGVLILNLTQHKSSPEQRAAGVIDLPEEDLYFLKQYLTFEDVPNQIEIWKRASQVARLASQMFDQYFEKEKVKSRRAMIGGAPYLMAALEKTLRNESISPVYAFSKRESVDQEQPDGSVRKVAVFRHLGFVHPPAV